MIHSANGVISTTSDDVLHMAWQDAEGNWHNCTTPLPQHKDGDGNLLSCRDAAKFAEGKMMGGRVVRRQQSEGKETASGPVNLPRPLNLAQCPQ